MSRRRMVVLLSAATLLTLAGGVVTSVGIATRTQWGRDKLRNIAVGFVNRSIKGKLYLGHISGPVLGRMTIDSIDLREMNDSLFVATGPVELEFDPRDLLEQRIVFSTLRITNPVVHLNEDSTGTFNFRKIFPSGPPSKGPRRATRQWGDFIASRVTEVKNLTLTVTAPWHPVDSLRGARRDSAITYALARTDKEIRRRGSGFVQVQRWTKGQVVLDSSRIDDRDPTGRFFQIRRLDIVESDPPFDFRNASGSVRMIGDSLWANVPHFELPASRGRMTGKVWWGGGPSRFNLDIESDSVSLSDIAWVYPTLPVTGGGRMKLAIRSQRDPTVIDYVITNMDVRSTDSWLRGAMTFGIGAPVLQVKDVDIVAQPLDFKLIERLSGEPLPYPWRGTITGTLKGPGGPVNRFKVDASDLVFRDANVAGAVTIGRLKGELDILEPSLTVFRGLDVDLDQLDLRTIQFLTPTFPRLNGIVAGKVTLDSSWLDVRLRNADLTHRDGSGPATRMTGGGRVTFGETFTAYDLALNAQPLSFTTLARAYTDTRIPLTGEYSGPLRLQGTLQDLAVSGELTGPSGTLAYDGRIDADSVGGYGVHGILRLGAVDLRTLLDTAMTPHTELTGVADIDVVGDSLANLLGRVNIELERSLFDSIRVRAGTRTRLRFADGRMHVDSLRVESPAASLRANGAIGTAAGVRDSIEFQVTVDSLGGWRRYLSRDRALPDSAHDTDVSVASDSIGGRVEGHGWVRGSVDSLGITGVIEGDSLSLPGYFADTMRVEADLSNLRGRMSGRFSLMSRDLIAAGIRMDSAGALVNLDSSGAGDFTARVRASNGPAVATRGRLQRAGDTTTVRLDSLDVSMDDHLLRLRGDAGIRVETHRIVLDTIRLRGNSGEEIVVAGDFPDSAAMRGVMRIDSVHLRDIGKLAQSNVALSGSMSAVVDMTGSRAAPELAVRGTVKSASVGAVNVAHVRVQGDYRAGRIKGGLQVLQDDSLVISVLADYPLALGEVARNNPGPDTLRVTGRSQDVDLKLIESFTTMVRNTGGRFSANLDLAGRMGSAVLTGGVRVVDGAATLPYAGIRLDPIQVRIDARNDTLFVERFMMVSGDQARDSLWFGPGSMVAHPLQPDLRVFNVSLAAREFHALAVRSLADIDVSADLQLRGTTNAPVANGNIEVVRGSISMPAESDKQLFAIDESMMTDSVTLNRLGLISRMPRFLTGLSAENLTVTMGPDVWLRSGGTTAIKLAGQVNVRVAPATADSPRPELVLEGSLQAERGQYDLDLGYWVRRTFEVQSGELRFSGDRGFNPLLNIRALKTVQQTSSTYGGRNDIRIGIQITGSLDRPVLRLVSADSLQLSESDMLSYLVAGVPSFSIGSDFRSNTSLASGILLGSISSLASSIASRFTGGMFDYVQLQTSADQTRTSAAGRVQNPFTGAQLGIGKQINSRLFASLTSGLCNVTASRSDFLLSLGGKVEARFGEGQRFGAAFSLEPQFNKLICAGTQTDVGFLSSQQRQAGIDFFRIWRR